MLSCWLSLKRVMKKVVWCRLQMFDGNLPSECVWQNQNGCPVCSAGQLWGMALAGRNAPGSSCVCSRAPAVCSEAHIKTAPLSASSSVSFLGVCGVIAVQPCCADVGESCSTRISWGHSCCGSNYAVSVLTVCVCISLQLLILEVMLHMELFLQSTVKYLYLLPNLLQKFSCCIWSVK